jgi:hypothetical protein
LLLGFENAFQFGKRGEIFFRARSALRSDQTGKVQCTDAAIKNAHCDCLLVDLIPASEACDFGKEIDFPEIGLQREHRRIAERRFIPDERQTNGKIPRFGMERASAATTRFRFAGTRE